MRGRVSIAVAVALFASVQTAIAKPAWVIAGPTQLSSRASVSSYEASSDICDLDAVLLSKPEASERGATREGRTVTTYSLTATDWWGMLSISCITFAPNLTPEQELSLLIGQRKHFVDWKDAKVLREKEIFVGGYPAMQIDLAWGEGHHLFTRVRIFTANDKLYMASIMATREFEKDIGISALLDAIRLRHPRQGSHSAAAGAGHAGGRVKHARAVKRSAPTSRSLPTPRPSSGWYPTRGWCAENGSCYGDISQLTGRPKTIKVRGYFRRDGTYVRGHVRSH